MSNNNEAKTKNSPSVDALNKSLVSLRKAIALMVQYKIPTTPTHYAVWYAYVTNSNSFICETINTCIKNQGFCTAITSEELYQRYLASPLEKSTTKVKESLEGMVLHLTSSMNDAISSTSKFNDSINSHFSNLSQITKSSTKLTLEQTLQMIENLVNHSDEILESSKDFTQSLERAQKEIATLKKELSIIKIQTTHDTLTGLLNRRALDEDLAYFLNIKNNFSLIMLDLDLFKNINDTYGHRIGDLVLKSTAKVLEERTNGFGKVYRYGGEEMVIILPNTTLSTAINIAEQCRIHIEKITIKERIKGSNKNKNKNQPPIIPNGKSLTLSVITASLGVAEANENDTAESIIDRADNQLYLAKKLGRNRVMPIKM